MTSPAEHAALRWRRHVVQPYQLLHLVDMKHLQARRASLHLELRTRLASSTLDLNALPDRLLRTSGVNQVRQSHDRALGSLTSHLYPSGQPINNDMLHTALQGILDDHRDAISLVINEVKTLQKAMGNEIYDRDLRRSVDVRLGHFFAGRVALRFLMQRLSISAQYASWHAKCLAERNSGSVPFLPSDIALACDPADVARAAGRRSVAVCRAALGLAPSIVVQEDGDGRLQYWPAALEYVMFEVFKNACKAVVERCAGMITLPLILCRVEANEKQVKIVISDEGGGIPPEHLCHIWSFASSGPSASRLSEQVQALSGFGVGLPLSRQYIRYLGGDMQLTSRESRGTVVRIILDRDMSRSEVLGDPPSFAFASSDDVSRPIVHEAPPFGNLDMTVSSHT